MERIQKLVDDILTVNLGVEEDAQDVQIGSTLNQSESNELTTLLRECKMFLLRPMRRCLESSLKLSNIEFHFFENLNL